ncbi:MAG: DUF58 domain-containing protein [Candidatus Xenobia bacterium]
MAAFLFVIATNTQSGWLYVVLALLLGLMGAGYWMPRRMVKGLTVSRRVGGPVRAGQSVTVELVVHNPTRWPRYYVGLHEETPAGPWHRFMIQSLPPRSTRRFSYQQACPKRGVFSFPPVILESATPFGLYWTSCEQDVPGTLVVHPVGPPITALPTPLAVPHRTQAHRATRTSGHSDDLSGIREYQHGEDFRHIHWPSTAKLGQLMVKEFHEVSTQSIQILIDSQAGTDFGRGTETTLEYAVAAATTLSDYVRRHNMSLTLLATSEQSVRALRHPRHDQHLDFLAAVTAGGRLEWDALMVQAMGHLEARTHFYVLTARPDLPREVLQPVLRRRGIVTVLLLDATSFQANAPFSAAAYQSAAARLATPEIAVNHYRLGRDIRHYLDGHAPT